MTTDRKPKGCLGRLWGFTWKATGAIIGLLILIGLIAGPPKRTESPVTEATGAVAVALPTNTPVPPTSTHWPTHTPMPTETPTPMPTLSPEEQILGALGNSNRGVERIAKFEKLADVINIEWAINDNLTESMIRGGAQMDVANVLKAVHNSGMQFGLLNLTGTFSMQDNFGNKEEMPVVWLTYSAATVDKINWDNPLFINGSLWTEVYTIADSVKLHPAMRDQ